MIATDPVMYGKHKLYFTDLKKKWEHKVGWVGRGMALERNRGKRGIWPNAFYEILNVVIEEKKKQSTELETKKYDADLPPIYAQAQLPPNTCVSLSVFVSLFPSPNIQ